MNVKATSRALLILVTVGLCIVASATLSSWFVSKQLAAALGQAPRPQAVGDTDVATVTIIFADAMGVSESELREHLQARLEREHLDALPLQVTLQNEFGDFLAAGRVRVHWEGGEYRLKIGSSGVLRFAVTPEQLTGLTLVAPAGYSILKQRTIALGPAYEPASEPDYSGLPVTVQHDGHRRSLFSQALNQLRRAGKVLDSETLRKQLRRPSCRLTLENEEPTVDELLTSQQIYRHKRNAVVVIGHLLPDGSLTQASGVLLSPTGIVATNYHVVDKPTAVARGVMTYDQVVRPVEEILAADRSRDVSLLRIDAVACPPVTWGRLPLEGDSVCLVSHPRSRYYSLTQGHVLRYWTIMSFGRPGLRMSVSTNFADGSSGGPLFDNRGRLAGLVSATVNESQMVHRIAIPVSELRKLLEPAANPAHDKD